MYLCAAFCLCHVYVLSRHAVMNGHAERMSQLHIHASYFGLSGYLHRDHWISGLSDIRAISGKRENDQTWLLSAGRPGIATSQERPVVKSGAGRAASGQEAALPQPAAAGRGARSPGS
jgi:hypothetical protein